MKNECNTNCDNCKHCCSVTFGGIDFEYLIDVCEKNDPHFKYAPCRLESPCKNFEEKTKKNG